MHDSGSLYKVPDEVTIEKNAKESMVKDSKNQKGQMTSFMDKVLK